MCSGYKKRKPLSSSRFNNDHNLDDRAFTPRDVCVFLYIALHSPMMCCYLVKSCRNLASWTGTFRSSWIRFFSRPRIQTAEGTPCLLRWKTNLPVLALLSGQTSLNPDKSDFQMFLCFCCSWRIKELRWRDSSSAWRSSISRCRKSTASANSRCSAWRYHVPGDGQRWTERGLFVALTTASVCMFVQVQIATLMQLQGSRADPAQLERLQSMLSEKNGEIQNLMTKLQRLEKVEVSAGGHSSLLEKEMKGKPNKYAQNKCLEIV